MAPSGTLHVSLITPAARIRQRRDCEACVTQAAQRRERKVLFFEKKQQNTFVRSAFGLSGESEPKRAKVFWFFFSKKNRLLFRVRDL